MSRTARLAAQEVMRETLRQSIAVQTTLLGEDLSVFGRIAEGIVSAIRHGRKVVLFGNGGCAAEAQHVAAELVNRFREDREALPALALSTDTSVITSVANDSSFERIFARQVEALVCAEDAVVGLSTSGNAANVCRGMRAARARNALTIGFTGREGGELKGLVDLWFRVPSDDTARIQEAHIMVCHALCEVVERELTAS